MASDPRVSQARRWHLIGLAITGVLFGLGALAAWSQPRGGSFIDGRGILAGGLVIWWVASALLSTALVWFLARGLAAVVALNLLSVVLVPIGVIVWFQVDDALWLRRHPPAPEPPVASGRALEEAQPGEVLRCTPGHKGQLELEVSGAKFDGLFEGVTVHARGCGQTYDGTTDEKGLVQLDVLPGDYTITAEIAGEAIDPFPEPVLVEANEKSRRMWAMPGPAPEGLRGRALARGAGGKHEVVANAQVQLVDWTGKTRSAATDADGKFEVRAPSGRYFLIVPRNPGGGATRVAHRFGWTELGDVVLSTDPLPPRP